MGLVVPGGFQNSIRTNGPPLSQQTINDLQYPYHTFAIIDTQHSRVLKQHTLVLNPQDITVQEPVRAQVTQTIGSAYVDDFGRGLPVVTISGHTGWALKAIPDGSGVMDGLQAFKDLRNNVFRYFTDAKDNVRTYLRNPYYQLRWYNWAEDEYYIIQPTEFDLNRSASQPLYYQYTFMFTCLQDLKKSPSSVSIPQRPSPIASTESSASIGVDVANLGALLALGLAL